jgi:hypothetical protein
VARYYRSDLKRNARISTEITGYAVSTLVHVYKRTGDSAYLRAAGRAAAFLLNTAWSPTLSIFPFEWNSNDTPEALAYFFDSGIIARGLLAMWRVTRQREYLLGAEMAAKSMDCDFRSDRGFHPILRLPSKEPLPYGPQWSRGPGCYQLKSALAWHCLHIETGEESYRAHYEQALNQASATEDAFLPADTPEQTMDRLHAYSYYLEGLLPVCDRPEVRAKLSRGIDRVGCYLREIRPVFERSDVNAQLLRVRLLASQDAGVPINIEHAREEAERILTFRVVSPDPHIEGGFAFGRKHGELMPYVNPVSTAFCIQALDMWADHQAGLNLERLSII